MAGKAFGDVSESYLRHLGIHEEGPTRKAVTSVVLACFGPSSWQVCRPYSAKKFQIIRPLSDLCSS